MKPKLDQILIKKYNQGCTPNLIPFLATFSTIVLLMKIDHHFGSPIFIQSSFFPLRLQLSKMGKLGHKMNIIKK